jgi:hypothetical protein
VGTNYAMFVKDLGNIWDQFGISDFDIHIQRLSKDETPWHRLIERRYLRRRLKDPVQHLTSGVGKVETHKSLW